MIISLEISRNKHILTIYLQGYFHDVVNKMNLFNRFQIIHEQTERINAQIRTFSQIRTFPSVNIICEVVRKQTLQRWANIYQGYVNIYMHTCMCMSLHFFSLLSRTLLRSQGKKKIGHHLLDDHNAFNFKMENRQLLTTTFTL